MRALVLPVRPMPPEQEGVTQDDDAGETGDKGLFRFMRRRPAKEKRSETEWVDTLRAQAEPEPDLEEEPESPFMAGEEPEEPPEEPPEPEPTPEHYRVERQWRRRHKDEMDEIHNYIDRVIGTDRDPLVRHRRLSDLGVNRHPGKKRELANVQVEGLDEELMIAFTFPKEELRNARMVYETEGGYVIEVTRAIGGDDDKIERQHYTVSRVGSVAHALDKLRAREIEQKIQENESRGRESAFSDDDAEADPGSGAPQEEEAALEERENPPVPVEETGPEEITDRHLEEPQAETPAPAEEEEDSERSGFMGGFASRFKRERGEPVEEDEPEAGQQESPSPPEHEPAQAETEEGSDEESPAKRGGLGAFASRLKPGKKAGREEPQEEEEATEPPEFSDEPETPEAPDEKDGKKSPFGALASRFKKSDATADEPETPDPHSGSASEPETTQAEDEDASTGKKGLFGMKRRGKRGDAEDDEA